MVKIKRYANRKLYNTETSRYITLRGISDLLSQGREVEVFDNQTGNDISSLVLSRVLADGERIPDRGADDGSPVIGEVVQRQLASLYTLLRRYAGDVQDNLSGVRDNVIRWIQAQGGDTTGITDDPTAFANGSAGLNGLSSELLRDFVRRGELAAITDDLARLAESVARVERQLAALTQPVVE